MQQRMAKRNAGRRRFEARGEGRFQGCNARARGSLRRHIRGKSVERARREARATAGTHSGRGRPPARQCVEGQQEARGARQRVALCLGIAAAGSADPSSPPFKTGGEAGRAGRAKAFWVGCEVFSSKEMASSLLQAMV